QSEFLARDFSVVATGATATNTGCGTAISVHYPGGTGPGNHRGVIIEHIMVGNDNVQTDNVSWSYFSTGIDLTGAPRPLLFDVTVAGPDGPDVHDNFADDAPQYLPFCAVRLDESYVPYLLDCKFWHGQYGV